MPPSSVLWTRLMLPAVRRHLQRALASSTCCKTCCVFKRIHPPPLPFFCAQFPSPSSCPMSLPPLSCTTPVAARLARSECVPVCISAFHAIHRGSEPSCHLCTATRVPSVLCSVSLSLASKTQSRAPFCLRPLCRRFAAFPFLQSCSSRTFTCEHVSDVRGHLLTLLG